MESILGLSGTIMGGISLVWHIWNNMSRLEIESFSCELFSNPSKSLLILKANLRNKSNKSTSIEKVYAKTNGKSYIDSSSIINVTLPINILPNSSYPLNYPLTISEIQFKELNAREEKDITLFIKTTHGIKKKKGIYQLLVQNDISSLKNVKSEPSITFV